MKFSDFHSRKRRRKARRQRSDSKKDMIKMILKEHVRHLGYDFLKGLNKTRVF